MTTENYIHRGVPYSEELHSSSWCMNMYDESQHSAYAQYIKNGHSGPAKNMRVRLCTVPCV